MSFIFMVFHWPEEGHRDSLAQSMREMRDVLAGTPGCVAVEPPYLTEDGACLVGISKWESRQAFSASGITLRPADEIVEGETRPRLRFFLEEAQAAGPRPPSTGWAVTSAPVRTTGRAKLVPGGVLPEATADEAEDEGHLR